MILDPIMLEMKGPFTYSDEFQYMNIAWYFRNSFQAN